MVNIFIYLNAKRNKHCRKQQNENNLIGVSVSCVYIYYLTCNERDILHTRFEPLIYVESEEPVVYLIRLIQPVDSHFGCDFTHYVYRELHKLFSFYCFRQCLFLFAFK
jgi:hypothetical protein